MTKARLLYKGHELRSQRHPCAVVVIVNVADAIVDSLCINLIQNLFTTVQNLVCLDRHRWDAGPRHCCRLGGSPELLGNFVRATQEVLIHCQKLIEGVRRIDDGLIVVRVTVANLTEQDMDVTNRRGTDGGTP
jgi:hypothetical protein